MTNEQKPINEAIAERLEKRERELKELRDKWSQTPYLDGIPDNKKKLVAPILENEHLFVDAADHYIDKEMTKEKMLSIVQKVFTDFVPFDLVSIQPMFGPKDDVFYLRFKYFAKDGKERPVDELDLGACAKAEESDLPEITLTVVGQNCEAKTRKLKLKVLIPEIFEETDWTDKLASDVKREITNEILTDLRNHAGTVYHFDWSTVEKEALKEQYEALYIKLVEISTVIHRKTLRGGANWIVCSKEIAKFLSLGCTAEWEMPTDDNVKHVYTMYHRWKIFVDPLAKPNEILMGYKGESMLDSGYCYNPYVFLCPTPDIRSEDFCPRRGFLSRYSKLMLREGQKFFAKLTITNFPESVESNDK